MGLGTSVGMRSLLILAAGSLGAAQRTLVSERSASAALGTESLQESLEGRVAETFDSAGPYDAAPKVVASASSEPGSGVPGVEGSASSPDDPLGRAAGAGPAVPTGASSPSAPSAPSAPGAQPANDFCINATVISGSTVTYNPPLLDTSQALAELCSGLESCAGGSVSNTVYWSYTPDQDGTITVDTIGSNYDTVLSIWDGCGQLGFPCGNVPNELACSDNYFFGTTSQIVYDVDAGETYLIKVSGKGVGGLVDFDLRYAPDHDACVNARTVPGTAWDPPLVSTHNATVEPCEGQENCEVNAVGVSNTVWYTYLPPCDGFLSVNTNGSTYDTVLSIFDGCAVFQGVDNDCILPGLVACDDDSGTGVTSQLMGVPLNAGVEYYIKVADYDLSQGGGWLDFNLLFTLANPPAADITSPASFACVCNTISVTGSASAGSDPLAQWRLEYQPAQGGSWSLLAASSSNVAQGTLATWNTSSLASGYYLLRLTVENGCGAANTDVVVVLVDHGFDSLDLRAPQSGLVLAGKVFVDGTAWDTCFTSYAVDYRRTGTSVWLPANPSQATYATAVINDPLVPGNWDTAALGLADGGYELRLTGTDQCGNTDQETVTVEIDNTVPVARINTPVACEHVFPLVTITGTAVDSNLASWQLAYTGGGNDTWTVIAQSTQPKNGTLATWDVSGLPRCAYTLRLRVVSQAILDADDPVVVEDYATFSTQPAGLQAIGSVQGSKTLSAP